MSELPLFPLHTVLFPGGRLSLRIFEPRYVDLVGRCLRDGGSFGVCLIREGSEAGEPPTFRDVGTSARIVDWSSRPDGLLGITIGGERRFRVLAQNVRKDRLLVAEVEWFTEPPGARVGPDHAWLGDLPADDGAAGREAGVPMDDAAMFGFRLAEVMPLSPAVRQELLEIPSATERLDRITGMIEPRHVAGRGSRRT